MKCSETEKWLDFYLKGSISNDLKLDLEAHIWNCEHCQALYEMNVDIDNFIKEDLSRIENVSLANVLAGVDISPFEKTKYRVQFAMVVKAACIVFILVLGSISGYLLGNKYENRLVSNEKSEPFRYNELFADDLGLQSFSNILNAETDEN